MGDGKTVVKLNYGLYRFNPGVGLASSANQNQTVKSITYNWADAGTCGGCIAGDKTYQVGEQGSLSSSALAGTTSVDPNLRQPYSSQVTAYLERQLSEGVGVRVGFVLNTINLEEKNDYWERFVLWESALDATPDIIFGVGTGDYKKVLYEYYVSHKLYEFADSGFNSHNQFIEIFFTNGLVGVVALIIMLGRPLYLSVRNQNILGTLTFFSFFIYGMTEVFLGRYQGVVFFALLHQSFVTYYLSHKPAFPLRDV